jgi:integrative and conjugative element protein (TIGR02256 family)
MTEDADRWFPLETGGILAGYRVGRVQVITDMIGPGPRVTRTRTSFEGDHEYQCELLDTLFQQSGGITVYLGDWHTHPLATADTSSTDRWTLRRIATHAAAHCPSPLMVIGAGGPTTWRWKAHVYERAALCGRVHSRSLAIYAEPPQH